MDRLTQKTKALLVMMAGLTTLTACGERGSGASFYREAGTQIGTSEFGTATKQNMIAQTCPPSGVGAGKIGAAPRDPIVALDPSSTRARPVYRIYCDGRLDGKYAQVVHAEYVESATQKPVSEDGEVE